MRTPIIRVGTGIKGDPGPAGTISIDRYFEDDAARDAYYVTNPSELVDNIVIGVGDGFFIYSGGWHVTNPLFVGRHVYVQDTDPGGIPGDLWVDTSVENGVINKLTITQDETGASGLVINQPLSTGFWGTPPRTIDYGPSITFEGGDTNPYDPLEAKSGKWRIYHNVAESGFCIAYNQQYNSITNTWENMDVPEDHNGLTDMCVRMRFDVSEGHNTPTHDSYNFWGIEWSEGLADWQDDYYGPSMHFFDRGDLVISATDRKDQGIEYHGYGYAPAVVLNAGNRYTGVSVALRAYWNGDFKIQRGAPTPGGTPSAGSYDGNTVEDLVTVSSDGGVSLGNSTTIPRGKNALTNGDFGSNTEGWTPTNCTLSSVNGGQSGNCLQITVTGESSQYAQSTAISTVVGGQHIVDFSVKDGSVSGGAYKVEALTSGGVLIGSSAGVTTSSWVSNVLVFNATTTSTVIRLVKDNASAGTMLFDTVSVKPILNLGHLTLYNFDQYGYSPTHGPRVVLQRNSLGYPSGSAICSGNNGTNENLVLSVAQYGDPLDADKEVLTLTHNRQVGVGSVLYPSANIHLPAGTAEAGTAPLKIDQYGTLLTTPEVGTMEYIDQDNQGYWYVTQHVASVHTRRKFGNTLGGATDSVADGGTITHGFGTTPSWVTCTGSVSGESIAVTAKGSTTFTVAIKKCTDGSAGTTQTVYWQCGD